MVIKQSCPFEKLLSDEQSVQLNAHIKKVNSCEIFDCDFLLETMDKAQKVDFTAISGDELGILAVFYLSKEQMKKNSQENMPFFPYIKRRGAHKGAITCMKHMKRTSLLVTGGKDGIARVWDLNPQKYEKNKMPLIREFVQHTAEITSVDIDPSQKVIVTSSIDGYIHLWMLNSTSPVLSVHTGRHVSSVSFITDDPTTLLLNGTTVCDLKDHSTREQFKSLWLEAIAEEEKVQSASFSKLAKKTVLLFQRQSKDEEQSNGSPLSVSDEYEYTNLQERLKRISGDVHVHESYITNDDSLLIQIAIDPIEQMRKKRRLCNTQTQLYNLKKDHPFSIPSNNEKWLFPSSDEHAQLKIEDLSLKQQMVSIENEKTAPFYANYVYSFNKMNYSKITSLAIGQNSTEEKEDIIPYLLIGLENGTLLLQTMY